MHIEREKEKNILNKENGKREREIKICFSVRWKNFKCSSHFYWNKCEKENLPQINKKKYTAYNIYECVYASICCVVDENGKILGPFFTFIVE